METLEDLAGLQHYFLQWNAAEEVTSDMIPEKMKAFNSLKLETSGSVLSSEEEEEEEDDECKEMRNLQRCLIPFVQLFFEIVAGDLRKAQEMLNEVDDRMILMTCETKFSEEYIPGFEYLHDLVQLHFHLAFKHVAKYDKLKHGLTVQDPPPTQFGLEEEFNELGNKSKCVVVVACWMLLSTNPNRREELPGIMIEVTRLDERNWYWYSLAYNIVRFARKQSGWLAFELVSGPSQDEIDFVTNALKHVGNDQSKGRARCIANLCQCLADIVAFQCKTGRAESVTLDKKYTSVDRMVDHLKAHATEALFSPTSRFNELIRFGDIFGVILPSKYRDYIIAAACLKTVCTKYPDNSKANHKMGALIINAKRDMNEAIYYFEQAIKLAPRSFPAWMDLLPALLRDYKENEAKVKAVLEDVRKMERDFTKTELGAFDFYEGSLLFLTGFQKKAVKLWRKSLQREYDGFKRLGIIRARFRWPNDHPLTFGALRNALDAIHKRQLEAVDEIATIQKMVDEADENSSNFYRHKSATEREDINWRAGQPRDFSRPTSIPPGSWRNHAGSPPNEDSDFGRQTSIPPGSWRNHAGSPPNEDSDFGRPTSIPPGSWRNHGGSPPYEDSDFGGQTSIPPGSWRNHTRSPANEDSD